MVKNNYQDWSKTDLIKEIERLKKRKKYDTKMGMTKEVAVAKIDGIYEYIKNENSKGKKIFGGIVTNTDTKYRGRWIYFDRMGKDFKKDDSSNWEDLEL